MDRPIEEAPVTEDAVRVGGTGAVGHPEETLATQVLLRNSIRPE